MENANQTLPRWFTLIGLSTVPHLQAIGFLVFVVIYMITLSGNCLLLITVRISPTLHTPMYFFLSNLSFIDIFFSSTVVPVILINTLSTDKSISVGGCVFQMFFSLVLGAAECVLLAVMAYDRFVAICRPLHYSSIMNMRFCIILALIPWMIGFINSFIQVSITWRLPFCRTHHVNHFFCEVPPFIRLSCRDPWLNEIAMYVAAGIIVLCCCLLTLISYVYIISTILKIHSSQKRHAVFSTCASHLTVVTLYYGAIMSIYLQPRSSQSLEANKIISVLYTVVTPMLNPIIYSIRNKDVKKCITTNIKKHAKLLT
ncbi:olfactory receptor 2G3-like [Bufo gargarizans]|uniref:olfactory receptor 2G3-like n=1 Tax=Bufo gargarizans TaxID=30331 RepID=UPI001CF267D6|nr:olfactory receptor 2G3-like [Bufo gargarizans]XP_044127359.1 olfactory receptor 2G3-like [Bufo gargarizans]